MSILVDNTTITLTNGNAPPSSKTLKCRVVNNGVETIRRFHVSSHSQLLTLLGSESYQLSYKDDEGDTVVVMSDSDLTAAFQWSTTKVPPSTLVLTATVVNQPSDLPPPASSLVEVVENPVVVQPVVLSPAEIEQKQQTIVVCVRKIIENHVQVVQRDAEKLSEKLIADFKAALGALSPSSWPRTAACVPQCKFAGIMHVAAILGDVDVLDTYWNNVYATEYDKTIVHFAAQCGQVKVLKWAVKRKFNLEGTEPHDTPLIYACRNRQLEAVQYLIQQKVCVNSPKECKTSPLSASLIGRDVSGRGLELIKCLFDAGADPNVCHHGSSLFGRVCESSCPDRLEIAKMFIEAGVNINMSSGRDLRTPLMNASVVKNINMVKLLIEAGAQLNQQDDHGYTALYLAVIYESVGCVEALLNAGANPNIMNKEGRSAIHGAIACNATSDCFRLLLQPRASLTVRRKDNKNVFDLIKERKCNQGDFYSVLNTSVLQASLGTAVIDKKAQEKALKEQEAKEASLIEDALKEYESRVADVNQ